ncbi:hypothetical protein [Aeromonas media]|uniref:hypothetical protein n=1 Tax=Aeromonas media TaxID=651 RepID=UPI0029543FC6|nr:hypothetical protein [Aeromonas media]WOQ13806.1 hypothetical protein R2X36_02605 [Aeromonas media]
MGLPPCGQPDPGLPPLLPLEYCRPERAAELLHCQVEDLFHWAAIGAIRFYVMAQKADYDGWLPTLVAPSEDFDAGRLRYGASFVFALDYGELTNSTTTVKDLDGYANSATLSGFWALNRWHFEMWEEVGTLFDGVEDEYTLHAYFSDEAPPVTALGVSLPGAINHLWLMRDDLLRLHHHISTGTPFGVSPENEAERVVEPGGKPVKVRRVMNKHLETIALLSKLFTKSDTQLSANRQYQIIAAGLESAGLPPLPVGDRQFRTWLSGGSEDFDDA